MPGKVKRRTWQEVAGGFGIPTGNALRHDATEPASERITWLTTLVEKRRLERFFGEHTGVDVIRGHSADCEAVADRILREAAIMFAASETLLLAGGDQAAVDQKRGIGIVAEIATDAENDG